MDQQILSMVAPVWVFTNPPIAYHLKTSYDWERRAFAEQNWKKKKNHPGITAEAPFDSEIHCNGYNEKVIRTHE